MNTTPEPIDVESLLPDFRRVASSVCPLRFREDFVSEMIVAYLQTGPGHSRSFRIWTAKCRALDWLRKQKRYESLRTR